MRSAPSGKPAPTARSLARLFDSSDEAIWIVDAAHRIAWMNSACVSWLGIDAATAIGRPVSASDVSGDPTANVIASLAPPLGLDRMPLQCALCEPAGVTPRLIRYLRIGEGDNAFVLASSGVTIATKLDTELVELNRLQSKVHQWRKRDAAWGGIAAAGSSRSAKRVRAKVQLAIATREDVSLVGPPGCGGEAIARRIHGLRATGTNAGSQVAAEPLVVIDGSLMDGELLDASLSPVAAHLGGDSIEEQTRTVTVLIRSLDETPLDVQERIEQFIAARGAAVRLLALMQLSVEQAVQRCKLIAPLAARLDVLSIQIDGLASRVEDIALIASAIVDARHAAGAGPAERLNRAAIDQLLVYPWPANFEELDAAMRHAVAVCSGAAIGPEHLPLAIRSYRPGEPITQAEPIEPDLDRAVERYELKLIRAAVEACGGNRAEAARRLGISRARLLRRLEESAANASAVSDSAQGASDEAHDSKQEAS
jgi:DNA-binding NtrC family response regulator